MIQGLQRKMLFIFVGMATGIVFLFSLFLISEVYQHLSMHHLYLGPTPFHRDSYQRVFDKAILDSIGQALIGSLFLSTIVGILVTRQLVLPLRRMKKVADSIVKGDWSLQVPVKGNDELAILGKALNHLVEQLQYQEQFRKHLTSDIAHELRTPLTTLKSHLEAFQDGIWQPTAERLNVMYQELDRLIHIVNDLEQLTQLDAPGFQIQLHQEDLASIVKEVARMMEASYQQKGIALISETPVTLFHQVDRGRIVQVLMNVLSNSLKFTHQGTVNMKLSTKNNKAIITIIDTGKGISAEELPYIFERLYRVDRSAGIKGSGIGLTIAKKLVEAHRGTIQIESTLGVGTTVTITLP